MAKLLCLKDIEKYHLGKKRRTCRARFRSLQSLSDTIQSWDDFKRANPTRYAVQFWILVEIAKQFYGKMLANKVDTELRDIAMSIGLVEGDVIENAAGWLKSNVDSFFEGIGKLFTVDPGTGAAASAAKVATSFLEKSDIGLVNRINQATQSIAKHPLMKGLAFQIDDFDSDFANAPKFATVVNEYLDALAELTSLGVKAPYSIAVSSAIQEHRRDMGVPQKTARKVLNVEDWSADELMQIAEGTNKESCGCTKLQKCVQVPWS